MRSFLAAIVVATVLAIGFAVVWALSKSPLRRNFTRRPRVLR
jgi:hypothetical protein